MECIKKNCFWGNLCLVKIKYKNTRKKIDTNRIKYRTNVFVVEIYIKRVKNIKNIK